MWERRCGGSKPCGPVRTKYCGQNRPVQFRASDVMTIVAPGVQNSRYGENIQLIGEGDGDDLSGQSALHRCRSTPCRDSSRGLEASRGHRLRGLSSRRCSHVPAHLQQSRCAKTVARQLTWLAGSPPMSGVLASGSTPGPKETGITITRRERTPSATVFTVRTARTTQGRFHAHK
jgi:hypothetical protein